MRANQRRRRRGAPRGPRLAQRLPNAPAIALMRALRLAGKFSRSGAAKTAMAWLDGNLVAAVDSGGRPFIASQIAGNGIEGRSGGIARRKRRRDDQWLAASIRELLIWLTCRKSGGRPGPCTDAAIVALAALDPTWPAIVIKLEAALVEIASTKACGFELCRLPPQAYSLIELLRR